MGEGDVDAEGGDSGGYARVGEGLEDVMVYFGLVGDGAHVGHVFALNDEGRVGAEWRGFGGGAPDRTACAFADMLERPRGAVGELSDLVGLNSGHFEILVVMIVGCRHW